jgi:sulfur dioxygenase
MDTHTHADHITATQDLRKLTGAKIAVHKRAPMPGADYYVEEGDSVSLGTNSNVKVLYTPGHTPDSISLYDGAHVFTGDVLLIGGTGRTDFAGGDPGVSFDSITKKLFTLPESTVVLPGHDYRGHTQSTIAQEKASNPRLAGKTRTEYIDIMTHLGLPLPEKIMESIQVNADAFNEKTDAMPKYSELAKVRQMPADELMGRIRAGAADIVDGDILVLDVRTPEEFRGELGHIDVAKLIPVKELALRAKELEPFRNRNIITVCRSGVRSTSAAAILAGLGFPHVSNLHGGMLAWREAGY